MFSVVYLAKEEEKPKAEPQAKPKVCQTICNYSLIIRDKKINNIVKSILIYYKNVMYINIL